MKLATCEPSSTRKAFLMDEQGKSEQHEAGVQVPSGAFIPKCCSKIL